MTFEDTIFVNKKVKSIILITLNSKKIDLKLHFFTKNKKDKKSNI
jgi:hypothetical protein